MTGVDWHVKSAAGERACREAGLGAVAAHIAARADAVIATDRGSADAQVEQLLAAGWTWDGVTDYVGGKRIRTLRAPLNDYDRAGAT